MRLATQGGHWLCKQQIMVTSEATCLPKSLIYEESEKEWRGALSRRVFGDSGSGLVVFICFLSFKPFCDQWESVESFLLREKWLLWARTDLNQDLWRSSWPGLQTTGVNMILPHTIWRFRMGNSDRKGVPNTKWESQTSELSFLLKEVLGQVFM